MHAPEQTAPAGLPPGPDLPSERQTARLSMRPLEFLEEQQAEFGEVFTVRALDDSPWVVVANPELIHEVLRAPPELLQAGSGRRVMRRLLGDSSLVLLDGERHAEQRRLLAPAFAGSRVEGYSEAMRAAAEEAMASLPMGEPTPVADWTRAVALEVILRAVFGVAEAGRLGPLRQAVGGLRLPRNEHEDPSPAFHEALQHADRLIFAEIAARRGRGSPDAGEDVLSLLLGARHTDGSPLSDAEVRDELVSLLVAGHETTATSLAWALERLARSPEALAKAEAEAAGGGGPYTDAVVMETLRMRPALPLVVRTARAPYRLGEHTVPAGAKVIPAILLVHHRADVYSRPRAFRPERFLDGPPPRDAWLPFGGGERRCIGGRFAMLEMRIVLATLLARATVRAPDPAPEALRRRDVTLTPSRGARLVLEPR